MVHVTLQSKGGVGKTYVASHIAQYLIEAKRPVANFDVDPGNYSLTRIKALQANVVNVFDEETGDVSIPSLDKLMQAAATEPADVVIDGGASSFQPLADYLCRMDAPSILNDHGRDLIIHSVIVGEPNTDDTLAGAHALMRQMPKPAKFVIWLNEFFGAIGEDISFEDTAVYAEHKDRIAGIVRLRKQSRFFSDDIAKMLKSHQTYAEAIDGAFIMTAQRLVMVRRSIWEQLAALGIAA